jgi:hypothetical protein
LEIYNEFCKKKKCLNCVIGCKIINSWSVKPYRKFYYILNFNLLEFANGGVEN